MKKILCPVRVKTKYRSDIFQGQQNFKASLSLNGSLFFSNFSLCDLGIMTCCLLDNSLKLELTVEGGKIERDIVCISFIYEWPDNDEIGVTRD